MVVEIDLNKLKRTGLSANQFVLLYLLYYKEWELTKELFSLANAMLIRDSLVETKYILSTSKSVKFKDTIISMPNVTKLLGIRSDKIAFTDFYLCYPIRVENRVLRAKNVDTVQGRKHEKKYLLKIKTLKDHEAAVNAIKAYIEKQRIAGGLKYLPNMETVLNNAMWEQWEVFIKEHGTEGANWNEDSI